MNPLTAPEFAAYSARLANGTTFAATGPAASPSGVARPSEAVPTTDTNAPVFGLTALRYRGLLHIEPSVQRPIVPASAVACV